MASKANQPPIANDIKSGYIKWEGKGGLLCVWHNNERFFSFLATTSWPIFRTIREKCFFPSLDYGFLKGFFVAEFKKALMVLEWGRVSPFFPFPTVFWVIFSLKRCGSGGDFVIILEHVYLFGRWRQHAQKSPQRRGGINRRPRYHNKSFRKNTRIQEMFFFWNILWDLSFERPRDKSLFYGKQEAMPPPPFLWRFSVDFQAKKTKNKLLQKLLFLLSSSSSTTCLNLYCFIASACGASHLSPPPKSQDFALFSFFSPLR